MYKEYMLVFQFKFEDEWINERFFFESEKNMIKFVKENNDKIKVHAAFKLEKLDNNIFT